MTSIKKAPPLRLSTAPASSMPMFDLMTLLEDHAMTLGANPAHYPLPADLPPRLDVPSDFVVPGRWQPRSVFADPALNDLAESIQTHGIINPLLVFANEHGKLELVAGERRLRAAAMANLSSVPVQLVEGEARALHEISILDNLQRENLQPWEEGAAFERMIAELAISEAELSHRLGKNRGYIQQRRALAKAAPELQRALAEEAISFGVARGILAGAAGDREVQRAGLTDVLALIKAGKPMKEDTARKVTAAAVLKVHEETLKGWGWRLVQHYSAGLVLWSPADRPRVVTEKELVDLVASGARPAPGDGPAPWEKEDDLVNVLTQRGYQILTVSGYDWEPWVYCSLSKENGGPQYLWFSGTEIPDLARAAQADIDEMEASLPSGWELRYDRSATFFVRDNQQTAPAYAWVSVLDLIEKLHQGTATLQGRPTCPQCGGWLDTGPTMYIKNARIHQACKDAAIEAERTAILAAPAGPAESGGDTQAIPTWVQHIPETELRALVTHFLYEDAEETATAPLADVQHKFMDLVEIAIEESRLS